MDGSEFGFDAVFTGTGLRNELVVVSAGEAAASRAAPLVTGLCRTLDQLGSKKPVTTVLIEDGADPEAVERISEFSRVLVVDSTAANNDEVRRTIAVLLPLQLPSNGIQASDPLHLALAELGSGATQEQKALIAAAEYGAGAVRQRLERLLADALRPGPEA